MKSSLNPKEIKPGDILVQTKLVCEYEHPIVVVRKVTNGYIQHIHINQELSSSLYVDSKYFRRPIKEELTPEVIKKVKEIRLRLFLTKSY